ncbi:MAG: hypothetical protein ABIS18_06655 [Actinomycetota bacterium]
MAKNSITLRKELVAQLVKDRSIKTDPIRHAFLTVARELFVPEIATFSWSATSNPE